MAKVKHCENPDVVKAGGDRELPNPGGMIESWYSEDAWLCTGGLFGIPNTEQVLSAKCISPDVNSWHESLVNFVEDRFRPAIKDVEKITVNKQGFLTAEQDAKLKQAKRELALYDESKWSKKAAPYYENAWGYSSGSFVGGRGKFYEEVIEIVDLFKKLSCAMDDLAEINEEVIPNISSKYKRGSEVIGQKPSKSFLSIGKGAKIFGISALVGGGLYFAYRAWEG